MYKIIEFCENRSKCRKSLISEYFESDDALACRKMCDNCKDLAIKDHIYEIKYTKEAVRIIELIQTYGDWLWTFRRIISFLLAKDIKDNELCMRADYGSFIIKGLRAHNIQRIIIRMLMEKILKGKIEFYGEHDHFLIELGQNHKVYFIEKELILENSTIYKGDENSDFDYLDSYVFKISRVVYSLMLKSEVR